jgi:hypothetical protein
MIYHASMRAAEPERVARAIAEIWKGGVAPAPRGIFEECWVAFGRDERGTQIEVHPLDFAFVVPSRRASVPKRDPARRAGPTAVHFAIASPRSEEEIHRIADREGWECVTCWRAVPGGGYGVVEVWVENRQMLEVLTPSMQDEYAETMAMIPKVIPPLV